MRVAVLGRTHFLLDVARRLHSRNHEIVLVATAPASPEYSARERDFEELAVDNGAPFHFSPDINSEGFRVALIEARPAVAVSINWPTLIGAKTCAAVPLGILNGHAGDLPRYRGNACPNWAI